MNRSTKSIFRAFGSVLGLPLAVIAFMLCWAGGVSAQQPVSLRMATIPLPNSFYEEVTKSIPGRIEQATKGAVKIQVFDSLIPGNELASAVRAGRVEMAATIHPYLSSEAPMLTLSHLPGLIDTAPEYFYALHTFWGDVMADIWRDKYQSEQLLEGIWATQVVWSMKPIHKLEDFRGLKVRVHNSETANLMTQLGAKPTPIAAGEMLQGLERGVIDAIITSIDVAHGLGFGKVAKHAAVWHFSSRAGWAIVMNEATWQKLPADVQNAIRQEMTAIGKEFFEGYNQKNSRLVSAVQESGVKFHVVPQTELQRLYDAKYISPVYQAWLKRAGTEGEALLKKAQAVLGKDLPVQ